MKRVFTILLLCMALARADAARATSVFSMVLIGERLEAGDTRSIALGGATQIVPDTLAVIQHNPALLGGATRVMFGVSSVMAFDEGRNPDYFERDVSVRFPTVRLAFPIAGLFVLSVGYQGRYDPDGSMTMPATTVAGVDYVARYTRSGGLFAIPFTVAFNVTRFASIGLTYSLEQGFVEERWDKEFAAFLFAPGAGFKKEDLDGHGFGGGLVLKPHRRVMLGGTLESQVNYTTQANERYTQTMLDTSYASSATLPARGSVAATVLFGRHLRVAGSYTYSDFTKFEGFGFDSSRLGQEHSWAVGVEHDRAIPVVFADRLPVRLSFTYQTLPFDYPRGTDVTRFLVGFGTGFPVRGNGKVDLALQIGQAGSIADNGIQDRLVRFYLSVTGAEKWTRRGAGGSEIGR